MKLAILTTYYERPDKLKQMIESVRKAQNESIKIIHIILDDCSVENDIRKLDIVNEYYKNYKIYAYRQNKNLGREKYWKTYRNLLRIAKSKQDEFDYVMLIPDDFIISRDFFSIIFGMYREGNILTYYNDQRSVERMGGLCHSMTESAAFFHKKVLQNAEWKFPRAIASKTGSRAWDYMSYYILDKNPYMQVERLNCSLAQHKGNIESKMNPQERGMNPLVEHRYIDTIDKSSVGIMPRYKKEWPEDHPRYLLHVYKAIGNSCIRVPLFLQMNRFKGPTDVYFVSNGILQGSPLYDEIAEFLGVNTFSLKDTIPTEEYQGQVVSRWSEPIPGIASIGGPQVSAGNEFSYEFSTARKINAGYAYKQPAWTREVLPLEWEKIRGSSFMHKRGDYVVLCNGGLRTGKWQHKEYKRWCEVVRLLKIKGIHTIYSVGVEHEYIYGTKPFISEKLVNTYDLISQASVFAGNCSGLTHFASLCGVPTVAVLTFTSEKKNWDPDTIDRTCEVITPGCSHYPCQRPDDWGINKRFWECNKDCQFMSPEYIADTIERKYNEHR